MLAAEQLNNAIYSLATLNPSNPLATNLNNSWQEWFAGARNLLPDPMWWSAFKGFWAAYASVRLTASSLSSRTPPASDIDPTMWKLMQDDIAQRGEALKDTGRAAGEAAMAAFDSLKPVLFVVALVGVGLLFSRGRR